MPTLTAHQADALRRVEQAFLRGAREVELGVPDGFGRGQVVAGLAETVFRDSRVLVVVPHPSRIAGAFDLGLGSSRRVGLILSDSEVEVASLSAAARLARDGRLGHGAILLDGLREDQAGAAAALVGDCPSARVVRVRDAGGVDHVPDGFRFPVRVVSEAVAHEHDEAPGEALALRAG